MRSSSPAWPYCLHPSQREQGSICSSQGQSTKWLLSFPAASLGCWCGSSFCPATLATGTIHISPFCSPVLHFPSGRAGIETNRGENCSWDYLQNYYTTCIFKRRCLWVHLLCAGWEMGYITDTHGAGKAQSVNKAHWGSLELRWWACPASWQSDSLAVSEVFVSPDNRGSKGYT